MFLRIPLVFLVTAISAVAAFAQSRPAKQSLLLDTKVTPFVEGKTLVREVRLSGLNDGADGPGLQVDDSISERDINFAIREARPPIQLNEPLDHKKVSQGIGIIKKYLFQRGYFNAKVLALGEEVRRNEMAIVFSIEKGTKGRFSGLRFQSMDVFSEKELNDVANTCIGRDSRNFNLEYISFCAEKEVRGFLLDHGYLQATLSTPFRRFSGEAVEIEFRVREGIRYLYGEIGIRGNEILTDYEIFRILEVSKGSVVRGKNLRSLLDSKLTENYYNNGYLIFAWDFNPTLIPPSVEGRDGIVNIDFIVVEGPQFKFAGVEFAGVSDEIAEELKGSFPLKQADVHRPKVVEEYLKSLNDSGRFRPIKSGRDIEVRMSEETKEVTLLVKIETRTN